MDKGILWIVFIWVIFCIIYFGFKWIKEKRKEVNYIDIFESMKKNKGKHSNSKFKW